MDSIKCDNNSSWNNDAWLVGETHTQIPCKGEKLSSKNWNDWDGISPTGTMANTSKTKGTGGAMQIVKIV